MGPQGAAEDPAVCAPTNAWYFAYGANMASSVLRHRNVNPKKQLVARLEAYTLSFDLLGVPYREPAMANLKFRGSSERIPVHGLAYLISSLDLHQIVATEGGGVAYDLIRTRARPVGGETEQPELEVHTLVARRPSQRQRMPSGRYLVSESLPVKVFSNVNGTGCASLGSCTEQFAKTLPRDAGSTAGIQGTNVPQMAGWEVFFRPRLDAIAAPCPSRHSTMQGGRWSCTPLVYGTVRCLALVNVGLS